MKTENIKKAKSELEKAWQVADDWKRKYHQGYDWQEVEGKDCRIVLEPRQDYCDRGNFLAKLFPTPGSELAREIDEQDGWPRYYFSEERAKLEIEAWLIKRGQVK